MNNRLFFFWLVVFYASGIGTSLSRTPDNDMKLSFTVKDASRHEALSDVVCRVSTAEGGFYAYAISDKNGLLSVSVRASDCLEFSFLGYKTLKKKAASYASDKINLVELTEENFTLREIAITAPPVSAESDTLIYNIASFARQGDSHLEDVLKKLPGIKVSDNGTVSYQGKAINKFYIEGKDLLGNSYNQATRNMPVDAVATVEILENHQPVKMLQGRQFTDKAALNIRLEKSHKLRPFGEIEGGIGCSPTIWDNRLFLTQVLGKSQLLITGKMNNTGTDISDETKEHIDVTDIDAYEPAVPAVLSPFLNMETLPQNRYLHNESYSSGANYIAGLSKDASLRMNILFYEDHSNYSNHYDYAYGGTEGVNIHETNNKVQRRLTALPILKYELNSRKAYISNELRCSFDRSSISNTLSSNGTGIKENVNSKPYCLQNYFTSSFSVGKQIVQARSLLRYFDRRETLADTADTTSFYNVCERYSTQSFVTKNMLSTSFRFGKHRLDLETKMYYRNNEYDYKGSARQAKLQLRFRPNYTFLFGTDRTLSVALPVEWMRLNLNASQTGERNRAKFSLSPGIYFKYRFTDKWKFVLSASMNTDNLTAGFYSPYSLRTTYRSVYIPGHDLFFNYSRTISARLNYRNLATMLFANASISYTDEKRESHINYDHTDSLTTVSYIKGDNHQRLLMVDAAFDKSFVNAGLALKAGINYNKTSYLLSQSGILAQNKSNVFAANIDITYQTFKWLRASIGATGSMYWEHNYLYKSDALSTLTANTSVYLFPLKKMEIKFTCRTYTNEISKTQFVTCNLFDVLANYRINKIIETGASFTNLLNVKSYTITQNSGINTFNSSLPLRGREILFRVLFRL